jgi:hypothetical protein
MRAGMKVIATQHHEQNIVTTIRVHDDLDPPLFGFDVYWTVGGIPHTNLGGTLCQDVEEAKAEARRRLLAMGHDCEARGCPDWLDVG